jgi:uncharacterized protein YegL
MMVLDRSTSMAGEPITDLKRAATRFVGCFAETQETDKLGLISFAYTARLDRALATEFVTPVIGSIGALAADGFTNAEDAIDQADGPSGLTDLSGVPDDRRPRQIVVFFSDGFPTGDGLATGSACGATVSTRWYIFDSQPVPGYAPLSCSIPNLPGSALGKHTYSLCHSLALAHAQELKDKDVAIFTIGLGDADHEFMRQLASDPGMYFYAPSSTDLESIFATVAQQIRALPTPTRSRTIGGIKARYR